LYFNPNVTIREEIKNPTVEVVKAGSTNPSAYFGEAKKSTRTNIPFLKDNTFDYASLISWAGDDYKKYAWIPFLLIVILIITAVSNGAKLTDGVDGLAAGVLSVIFGAYGIIGLIQDQMNIATFSFVIMGALLAFLWFNIPPARFYLGETGILSLTLSLSVIIFLTNTVLEFIIIGLPLVVTAGSSTIQIISRRFFGRKIFKVAPLHHHLESIGWSRERITMRYWIISVFCAVLGIILIILK